MKVIKINPHIYVFQFPLSITEFSATVNVSSIIGENNIYIIDTSYRSDHMKAVVDYLASLTKIRSFIVFNTHSDFDHVLGNCFFKNSMRISTKLCYNNMNSLHFKTLKDLYPLDSSDKVLYPNLTFSDTLFFPGDDLVFFASPIHTKDSACCFLQKDSILFAGDNVEEPIPYLNFKVFSSILNQYNKIINLKPQLIIPGHGLPTKIDMIYQNMKYLNDLHNNQCESYSKPPYKQIHETNRKQFGLKQ